MLVLLGTVIALALHIFLGWQWSIVGGVIAGFGAHRFGWVAGMISVTAAWLLLITYNFATAPAEMARFVEVVSGLLGNMPGPLLVVSTMLLGAVLGLLGGTIGGLVRILSISAKKDADNGENANI